MRGDAYLGHGRALPLVSTQERTDRVQASLRLAGRAKQRSIGPGEYAELKRGRRPCSTPKAAAPAAPPPITAISAIKRTSCRGRGVVRSAEAGRLIHAVQDCSAKRGIHTAKPDDGSSAWEDTHDLTPANLGHAYQYKTGRFDPHDATPMREVPDAESITVPVKATLIKYRHRHDAWKARRLRRMAPGRLAVLPSRAVQPAGLPGITPSLQFNGLGPPLSARTSSVRRLDSQPGCRRQRPCEMRADRGGDDGDT